jgi:hypothetical protein
LAPGAGLAGILEKGKNYMTKSKTKPVKITADNFTKLLAKKDAIEKKIAKEQRKLEKVKNDLKGFKELIEKLTA